MNILVICDTFTKTLPTSMCLQAIINEGINRGHICRIASSNGLVFDSKVSLEYKNSGDLRIQTSSKSLLSRVKKAVTPFVRYHTWPGKPFVDLDSFYQTIVDVIDSDHPDVIICSIGAFHNISIGCKVKENYPDIKYVPYYLDSILGGAKLRMMPGFFHNSKALKWEEKYLQNADSIVMMKYVENKYQSLSHAPSYYNKIKFLDLPLYIPVKKQLERPHNFYQPDSINMFFAGSMPKNIRNPKFLFSVFRKVKRLNFNFYIAGTCDYQTELERLANNDARVHLLGVIPHDRVLEMMNEADILLSIGNDLDCMIPCKIFEYMSTGKPILATYKHKSDPSIGYFGYYKNSLLLDERMGLDDAASRIDSFLDTIHENNREIIDALYDNTPTAFWEHIESL